MRNVFKISALLGLMVVIVFAMSSFVKMETPVSEKSCTVTITYGNGDPADNVTVSACSAHGSHDFKTDSKGVVKLTWEYFSITHLWIKGDKYEVDYSDGKSYSLTLKKRYKNDRG